MPSHENTPAGHGAVSVAGERAEGALRDVDDARALALLSSRLTPAWYGPAAAAVLIVPALGEAWSEGRGGWGVPLSLLISLAGLAAMTGLAGAARRRAHVTVTVPWPQRLRRAAVPLLLLLAAGIVTYVVCRQCGADRGATKIALCTVLGLGAWVVLAVRNKSIKQQLQAGSRGSDERRA
ncbi:hypothetical protein [Streptomyces sp. NPDC093589]|uniref:hypothetical protein n=1 Tax=Streptomyces sp. NPDC093589 TaxID=3366043 RepID=UPI003824B648